MQDNFANLRTFKDIVGHQIQFKDIVGHVGHCRHHVYYAGCALKRAICIEHRSQYIFCTCLFHSGNLSSSDDIDASNVELLMLYVGFQCIFCTYILEILRRLSQTGSSQCRIFIFIFQGDQNVILCDNFPRIVSLISPFLDQCQYPTWTLTNSQINKFPSYFGLYGYFPQ